MYFGPMLVPLSLAGLLCKGSSVAAVHHTMVSVVVPVFNGERTIEPCIRRILSQSLRPLEVIVVDDCSTDETPVILGRLSQKYSNIVVLRNKENLGKAASLTSALSHVHSPFTAIVDSDTYLERDYLKKTLGAFLREDIAGVSGMVLPSDLDTKVSRSRLIEYLHGQSTYRKLHTHMGVSFVSPGCCSIWRTSWIKSNGVPAETVVEDMDLTWETQADGNTIAYVPDAIAYTEEPKNFKNYLKQISRWFSWRPVLEKHAKDMTNWLKLIVSLIFVESIGYLFWLGLMLYFLFSRKYLLAITLFSIDLVIILAVSLYQGFKIRLPLGKVLLCIPYYYLLRIPTVLTFWKSLISPKRAGW